MPGRRYRLVFERSAEETLGSIGIDVMAEVLASLECLETDPYLEVGGVFWKKSYAFRSLKKLGIDIRVFKAFEIQKWRVFFFIDEIAKTVMVKEIVRRRTDTLTFGVEQPHVQRLVENYRTWLQRRVQ